MSQVVWWLRQAAGWISASPSFRDWSVQAARNIEAALARQNASPCPPRLLQRLALHVVDPREM